MNTQPAFPNRASNPFPSNAEMPGNHQYSGMQPACAEPVFPALESRFHHIERIGNGAQASMLKAISQDGTPVAIKVFNLSSAQNWKDAEYIEREINVLKTIRVQGVPKYIETIKTDTDIFLVEEYIDAPSLEQRMKRGQIFSTDDIRTILLNAAQILDGLGKMFPPIVHRDIKPGNLLVDDSLNVYLVDFGVVATKESSSMTFAGTAGYVAPEQLLGKCSTASDVYSLGATILHLVSGISPCDMPMNGFVPNFDECLPVNTPAWLRCTIQKMMAPNVDDRLKSGAELLEYTHHVLSTPPDEDVLQTSNSNTNDGAPALQFFNAKGNLEYILSTKDQINAIWLPIIISVLVVGILFIAPYLGGHMHPASALVMFTLSSLLIIYLYTKRMPAPSNKSLQKKMPVIRESVSCVHAGLKTALTTKNVNLQNCDKELRDIVACDVFSDLKEALDKHQNIPLTPAENDELDAYLYRKDTLPPCLLFPQSSHPTVLQIILTLAVAVGYLGVAFVIVPNAVEAPSWAKIIYCIVNAACMMPILLYPVRYLIYHKPRITPERIRAEQLYYRRFLDECEKAKKWR